MSRQYAKAEELNGEVFRKKAAGETNREKAESYGLQTIVSFYTFSICETYLPNPEHAQFYNFKRIEWKNGLTPNPIRSRAAEFFAILRRGSLLIALRFV